MNNELFVVERDGVLAGEQCRARGLDPRAMIKGVFNPLNYAGTVGMFEVRRGSFVVFSRRMGHDDVVAFWRGFVVGLEAEKS
jgi:hypothetical protein